MEPTVNTDTNLAGQIMTDLPLLGLLPIVAAVFDRSEIRESSHYTDGHYIRVDLGHDGRLIFERCSDVEYLVYGDADFPGDLIQAAERLKEELAKHDLIHRFEVYRGDLLFGEVSHNWQSATKTTTEQVAASNGGKASCLNSSFHPAVDEL